MPREYTIVALTRALVDHFGRRATAPRPDGTPAGRDVPATATRGTSADSRRT